MLKHRVVPAGGTYVKTLEALVQDLRVDGMLVSCLLTRWTVETRALKKIASLRYIPTITDATSPKLSPMTSAPHLIRLIPQDNWAMHSLVKIMRKYGWTRFFTAYDGTSPWSVDFKDGITDLARQSGIAVTSADISGGQASIEDTLVQRALVHTTGPFTVFLFIALRAEVGALFLRAVHRLRLQQPERSLKSVILFPEGGWVEPWMKLNFLATESLVPLPQRVDSESGGASNATDAGTAGSTEADIAEEAKQYMSGIPGSLDVLDMVDGSIALDFTAITGKRADEAIAFHTTNGTTFAPTPLVARLYDSVVFAAAAFQELISRGGNADNYTEFYRALRAMQVEGITGPLAIEEGTNDMVRYHACAFPL